jgi:TRAP-type C4-dicarboxylate transport system substrate-binding protein
MKLNLRIHLPAFALALAAVLFAAPSAQARGLVLKIGTVAPKGTAWAKAMEEMGEKFEQISGGKVKVRLYAGVVGDEPTIVRKMRVGQLHGAVLTSTGLSLISPEPMVLQLPMMFDSYAELDAVRAGIEPELNAALDAKGFVVMSWGDAGWLHFFTKKAAASPTDINGVKMWMWAHDPHAVQVFKEVGFNPVVLSSVDMIPSLQTGMIDAVPATSMVALSVQVGRLAPHMIDVRWAPVIGAIVISKKAWDKVPEALRPQLRAAAAEVGLKLRTDVRAQSEQAVDAMVKGGLKVHKPDSTALEAWKAKAAKAREMSRGKAVDAALMDKALSLRDKARASK